jgi:hypothetical protein
MKIGDKVIVTKPIAGVFNQKAVICGINRDLQFYRVELTESRTKSGGIACNIFLKSYILNYQDRNESIELDIQEIRMDKLNHLGIN